MKIYFISAILVILFAVGGIILLFNTSQNQTANSNATAAESNVALVDGKQIIDISAKGGYAPLKTEAKAGIPTLLKVETNGTYDCSSALRIPDLAYDENLPPSGETTIEIPPQEPGAKIDGLCAMGMYNFSVTFN